jgi:fructokinase
MDKPKNLKAVCYGEVLWDVFANEKKIGGAPLNVALRMRAMGCDAAMISCVGNDQDGNDIINHVEKQGLDTGGIIKTNDYPTGVVQVFINERGSASYEISYPSAWDKIVLNDHARNLVKEADVLIYGSLICRDVVSKNALEELMSYDVYKVFDVNLRKPFYSIAVLEDLMHAADFVKFNDEELLEIAAGMGSSHTLLEDNMEFMAKHVKIKAMCVTKGKHGATLMWNGELYHNNGYPIAVADTVGAGDSFLAALVTGLLSGDEPQRSIDTACAVGALVAGEPGANPYISKEQIDEIMLKV